MSILEIQKQLQAALSDSAKAQSDYEVALAKLEPLKQAAEAKQAEVNSLIHEFQKATGAVSGIKTRRGPKKVYKISNESKISRVGKSAFKRAINAGLSEAEAKKAQRDAEKSLSAKLGVK